MVFMSFINNIQYYRKRGYNNIMKIKKSNRCTFLFTYDKYYTKIVHFITYYSCVLICIHQNINYVDYAYTFRYLQKKKKKKMHFIFILFILLYNIVLYLHDFTSGNKCFNI